MLPPAAPPPPGPQKFAAPVEKPLLPTPPPPPQRTPAVTDGLAHVGQRCEQTPAPTVGPQGTTHLGSGAPPNTASGTAAPAATVTQQSGTNLSDPATLASICSHALGRLHEKDSLGAVLSLIHEKLFQDLLVSLLRMLDQQRCANIASLPEVDAAFRKLAPYMENQIATWSREQRKPLYVCPANLDPDMQGGDTSARISNFTAIQECLLDRYLPLAAIRQRKYIGQFHFKCLALSRKSYRRYWDTWRTIPWKAGTSVWTQFRKHVAAFEHSTAGPVDTVLDVNQEETEVLREKVLGTDAYRDEHEEDSELSQDEAEEAEDVEAGDDVADAGASGWLPEDSLQAAPQPAYKYIANANSPITVLDNQFKSITPPPAVGTRVQMMTTAQIVQEHGTWCQVKYPQQPAGVWVYREALTDIPPKRAGDASGMTSHKRIAKDYDATDFESEVWPEFARSGNHKSIGTLSDEAGRKLKNATTTKAAKKRYKWIASTFSKNLEKAFPSSIAKDDSRWEVMRRVVESLGFDEKRIRWDKDSILITLKQLFVRLRALKQLDPSL